MKEPRSFSDKIWLILKGLGMGAANKVPGVSGGVVAFVAGFYEEFIYSLQKINRKAFKLLVSGRFKSFYRYINGQFLGLLILGMLISYFSVSKILDYLILHYELFVWSAFFGMIVGSIYYIAKDFDEWTKRNIAILLCGIIAGVAISFLEPAKENDNLFFVFLCGIISVSGMTLPGLSGSFILILLGNYVLLLVDSVNALYDTFTEVILFNFDFLENSERIRLLKVLASFTLGSITGLVTLSHLLGYLLKQFKNATYAGIIGFIAGSLGVVWPWKEKIYSLDAQGNFLYDIEGNRILSNYKRFIPNSIDSETFIAIFFIFVGILLVLALGWYGDRTKSN
ncbi:DUF368 domain-containing protein [Planktosalinus lacus]|uniref:DUF368 domain-containing protein n=1 Tax=Planktosalinus lacus TaxID=1526573 RepID=A0A8J2Y828_9FLAO|nr:DUF368 domain-containing protein [Planktosalinus lacus]GGD90909.1 DUF368 domain-containing protein [Planktosalinus lacus]